MHALVLGGTRFLGLRVTQMLLENKHDVTVVSRRPERAPAGARVAAGERDAVLAERLRHERFDLTLDFTCHRAASVEELYDSISPGLYVLISSAWAPRLAPECRAAEPIPPHAVRRPDQMLDVTYRYLAGKIDAETAVVARASAGSPAAALRLPIFWGNNDHTGRLEFYRSRIADGDPLIMVDGGRNRAQIAWVEDLAAAIVAAVGLDLTEHPIWEALPDAGMTVRDVLGAIAAACGQALRIHDMSCAQLEQILPGYLKQEPLWREEALAISDANLFVRTGHQPVQLADWIRMIPPRPPNAGLLRQEERRVLATLTAS